MESKTKDMRFYWDSYGDDISAFLGGFSFTTLFIGDIMSSLVHIMAVGLFGGIMGVIGKEVGTWLVRKIKGMFKN